MKNDNSIETHPSYCLARINRVQGGNTNFYGSVIKPNYYLTLELVYSQKRVSEFGDEHFDEMHGKPSIAYVKMTHHQFAELITTMNTGNGTPVTLTRLGGVRVEECPSQTNPLDNVITSSTVGIQRTKTEISERVQELRELTDKPKLSAADKKRINHLLGMIDGRLDENLDFYERQIQEVGVKVVSNVRTEIDALVTSKVVELGLGELNKLKIGHANEQYEPPAENG